ncbi:MAG: hypothetical protein MUF58_10895 [Arcicella sp.]|jgi:hypothetical protein|nr:hypothetical protein [Arcicella sp.]
MKLKLGFLLLGIYVAVFSCKQDELVEATSEKNSKPSSERVAWSALATNNVTFDGRGYYSGQNYTRAMAAFDHGNIVNHRIPFNNYNYAAIEKSGTNCYLRVFLPKDTHSDTPPEDGNTGFTYDVDIPNARTYVTQFDVVFGTGFDFSRGGKVGSGITIGVGAGGCYDGVTKKMPTNGASVRFMWVSTGSRDNPQPAYFKPYIYHNGLPANTCGEETGKLSVQLKTNTIYRCYMKVTANTGNLANGYVFMSVNGVPLYEKSGIKFTNYSPNVNTLVDRLSFNVFRGGSGWAWTSKTTNAMYFDNIQWRIIP